MRFNVIPLVHFINVAIELKGCTIATLSCHITGSGDRLNKYINGTEPKIATLNKIEVWAKKNNIPFDAKDCIDFD